MDIGTLGMLAGAGALSAMIGLASTHAPTGHPFGASHVLTGADGTVAAYTVTELAPSADFVPVSGRLFQATVTVQARRGAVTPMIALFNARAAGGQTYPALATTIAQGMTRDTVTTGQPATGRIYFDVVGETPDAVVCNNGMTDLMVWEGATPDNPALPPPSPDAGIAVPAPYSLPVSI